MRNVFGKPAASMPNRNVAHSGKLPWAGLYAGLAAIALLGLLLGGCPQPEEGGTTTYTTTYTVSGTISTDDPAGPVSGANVQLKQGGGNAGSAVSTGADGTYTISSVPAGTGYSIEVSLAG